MTVDPLTNAVHELLADFEAGRLPPETVAFQDALRAMHFDYTVSALPRIDRLLRGLRERLQPDHAAFIASPGNRGFLRVLAAMVGETAARYMGLDCRWLAPDELRAGLRARGLEHPIGESFGHTLSCEVQGLGFMIPLAAVEAALFSAEPPLMKTVVDALLQRVTDDTVLEDPGSLPAVSSVLAADAAWRLGQTLGALACFLIDTASGDAPFAPLLFQQRGPTGGLLTSMIDLSVDEAIQRGRERLSDPEADFSRRALGYDGYVRLPAFRSDAIWIEAAVGREDGTASAGPVILRALLALPYRPVGPGAGTGAETVVASGAGTGLRLHRPHLLDFSGDAAGSRRLRAGLFARLKQTTAPVGPWAARFVDERSVEEIDRRRAGLPTPPWQARGGRTDAAHALLDEPGQRVRSETRAGPDDPLRVDARGHPATDGMIPSDLDLGPLRAEGAAETFASYLPPGLFDRALTQAIRSMPHLLGHGRVVWGRLVQANNGLYEQGLLDAPGVVLYSQDGRVTPEALGRLAAALMSHRGRPGEIKDAATRGLVEILDAETEHVLGRPVPDALGALAGLAAASHIGATPGTGGPAAAADLSGVLFSAIWLVRLHLPTGRLLGDHLPLLISDEHPGHVMVAPSVTWPRALLEVWEAAEREVRRRGWYREQQRLSDLILPLDGSPAAGTHAWGRSPVPSTTGEEDWEITETRRNARGLITYAQDGIALPRMRLLSELSMVHFPHGTRPPPMEWEWELDMELRSRARRLLSTFEGQHARGVSDPVLGRQAFAAAASGQMIAIHRRLLVQARGVDPTLLQIESDEIQYPVLGLLCGADPWALRMATLLLSLWRIPGHYTAQARPEACALARLLAEHLRQPLPALAPFAGLPALEALLAQQAWRGEAGTVARLMEAAFVEHQERAPVGPFLCLPLPLLLMQSLRERAGLPLAPVDEPCLRLSFMADRAPPPSARTRLRDALDEMADPLVRAVRARMIRMGLNDDEIEAATLAGRPPQTRPALARPLPASADPSASQGR